MNETSLKVQDKVVDDFYPVALKLRLEGRSNDEIQQAFQNEIKKREKDFYRRKNEPALFSDILKNVELENKADSRTEVIFYRLLEKNNIKFQFQYKIGRYRADFLVNDFLVVEIDGPQHQEKHDQIRDKYMRKLGYKILRIPIFILTADPRAIIEEVKQQARLTTG